MFKGTHGSGMVMEVKGVVATCIKAPCSDGQGPENADPDSQYYSEWRASRSAETRREIAIDHLPFLRWNCHRWLKFNFSAVYGEMSYNEIPPGCIFEELITSDPPTAEGTPDDLKIYTARGRPMMIMLFTDRSRRLVRLDDELRRFAHASFGRGNARQGLQVPNSSSHALVEVRKSRRWGRSFSYHTTAGTLIPGAPCNVEYDKNLTYMAAIRAQCGDQRLTPGFAITPETLARALRITSKLAHRVGTPAVRVDFMSFNGKLVFGELTFTPAACSHRWRPMSLDHLLGEGVVSAVNITSECLGAVVGLISCGDELGYSSPRPSCGSSTAEAFPGNLHRELRSVAASYSGHMRSRNT